MRLLEVVSQVENDYKSVVVVGHNPGMEELLQLLTGKTEDLPTATVAKIPLKISRWTDVANKKATLEWLVKARELQQG